VPFVLWLSVTGSIYLFKPQMEAWLDRSYDDLLQPSQTPATPELQIKAAIAAIPGSSLSYSAAHSRCSRSSGSGKGRRRVSGLCASGDGAGSLQRQ
jgi:uncharacterized iron-regulated membrane protein